MRYFSRMIVFYGKKDFMLRVRIDKDTYEKLKQYCAGGEKNVSECVRELIEKHLDNVATKD